MALSLTYDSVLSRVRISATGAPSEADNILVERSINQINWTTVRGGTAVPLSAGAASLDDYEFTADVANYYRVSYVDTAPITFVAAGAAATGNNASVVPALPAGWAPGDLLIIFATIRNSGTGTVNVPAGWTAMLSFGNMALLGRRAQAGDTAPTVTFTGGVAGADTIAQCAAYRNAELVPLASATQLNGSAQNIGYPAQPFGGDGLLYMFLGWKQDDWTSVATIAGCVEIGEPVSIAGDDAGQVWDHLLGWGGGITADAFAVTGGVSAISRGAVLALGEAAFVTQETANIAPVLDGVWLKSLARPFLNRKVTVVDYSDVERASRSGVFPIVGRSFPVAVTDLHGSRQWTLDVLADTAQEAEDLDLLISTGEVQFVHVPAAERVPGGYVALGNTTERRPGRRSIRRVFSMPFTECAAPGPDVIPAVGTWQTVLNTYATWADVLAAHPTWESLLQLVGSPADVVVP